MRLPVPLAAALILAATLAGPAASRDRNAVPVATLAGAPRSCIPLTAIRESRVRSDTVIDFVMRDRTVYRNTLPYGCPGLNVDRSFSYATSLSQLCSVDIITVFRTAPLQRGASCGLGQFQPVTLEPEGRR